jgi:hypothetical protein
VGGRKEGPTGPWRSPSIFQGTIGKSENVSVERPCVLKGSFWLWGGGQARKTAWNREIKEKGEQVGQLHEGR